MDLKMGKWWEKRAKKIREGEMISRKEKEE